MKTFLTSTLSVLFALFISACGKPADSADYTADQQNTLEYQIAKLNDYQRDAPKRETVQAVTEHLHQLAAKLNTDTTSIANTTVIASETSHEEYAITLGPLDLLESMDEIIPEGIASQPHTYSRLLAVFCGMRASGKSRDEAVALMKEGVADLTRPAASLHEAIGRRDVSRVEALLSDGASVDARDDGGMTPLHLACLSGQIQICRILIENGADVNATDSNGIAPLAMAALADQREIVLLLLSSGSRIDARNSNGFTALHTVANGDPGMAELLIISGADVNAVVDGGLTPLHLAAVSGNEAIVRLLIKNGAVSRTTSDAPTPAEMAHAAGHDSIVTLLTEED